MNFNILHIDGKDGGYENGKYFVFPPMSQVDMSGMKMVTCCDDSVAREKKRMSEEVEKMKTYTGGSSVNEKDRRVNKQEVLSIINK